MLLGTNVCCEFLFLSLINKIGIGDKEIDTILYCDTIYRMNRSFFLHLLLLCTSYIHVRHTVDMV